MMFTKKTLKNMGRILAGCSQKVACAMLVCASLLPVTSLAQVVVESPWARETASGAKTAAVYFVLKSPDPVALVAVETPVATQAQLHVTQYDQNGMMQMNQLQKVSLSAGVEVGFAPNGHHVMLVGLTQDLVAGYEFPLKLIFDNGHWQTVKVLVRDIGYVPVETGAESSAGASGQVDSEASDMGAGQ